MADLRLDLGLPACVLNLFPQHLANPLAGGHKGDSGAWVHGCIFWQKEGRQLVPLSYCRILCCQVNLAELTEALSSR